jgi:colicin import membrane protein
MRAMVHTEQRPEFTPPPADGQGVSLALALLVHALLVGALALGVQWRSKSTPVTVEAELWSSIPESAAPVPVPPPPVKAPPLPEPAQAKAPPQPAPAPVPPAPDPQIVQEQQRQEKLRLEKLQKEKLQKEKQERERLEREKLKRDKEEREKKAAPDPRAAAKAAAVEAKKVEEFRQQNLQRMAQLAGGGGSGTAAKSKGPSAEYAGRIRARIKPNITYTDTISGNPTAEVEVRTSADGTIISRKISRSSGVPSWDDAVLAAIDKTEILPRDVDGKVPSSLVISFRPKD